MIYPERESKILEFKSTLSTFKAFVKTCVAFANGVGGELIIGIEDETKKIIGIDIETKDKIYEGFPNALYDSTQPSLVPYIYEKTIGDKSILIIKIAPTNRKPCFIKSDGIPNGVYCRVGPHTRKASQDHIEELMRDAKHIYYDNEPVHAEKAILDRDLLAEFYSQKKVSDKRLLNDKILTHAPGNEELLIPTVAGTLFFCDHPEKHIPEAEIICTRFAGTSGRDIIQTEEVTGNLIKQAGVSLNLVKSWLKKNYQQNNAKLSAKTIVPEIAIREAINNALLHRKYSIPGAIKIAVYEDRLEVFSPGQFPGLVDINHLGDGTTFLRNPAIVRLARHYDLVEKLGSGIKLIFSSCEKAGLKKPAFFEDGDFVKVVFYFAPSLKNEKSETEMIMALFKFQTDISANDVAESLMVSRNTATRYLNELVESKKIIRQGKGPATRYIMPK